MADKGINNPEEAKVFFNTLMGTVKKASDTICGMIMQGFPVAAPVAMIIAQVISVLTTLAMAIFELFSPNKEQDATLEKQAIDNNLPADKQDMKSELRNIKTPDQIIPSPVAKMVELANSLEM